MEKKNYFRKSLRLAVAGFGMVAAAFTITSCERETTEEITPLGSVQDVQEHGALIPGKYIVVLKKDVDFGLSDLDTYEKRQAKMRQESQGILRGKGIPENRIENVYGAAIKGMAVGLTNSELQQLRNDPRVAYIEQDRVIKLAPPAGKGPNSGGGGSTSQITPWGINRVGGAVPATTSTGTVWVIDSGVDLDHPDLNVDRSRSITVFTSGSDGESPDDLNGHGSHVAGTIAALDNTIGVKGVVPGAKVVAVKVLDRRGSGSYSGVIQGINYVAGNGATGDVANMSLGGSYSKAINDAVKAASAKVKFVVAAGNDGGNASNYSPASAEGSNIYTISAIDATDKFASWSNWGNPPVDYAAPGVSIYSTWKDGGYNTISGTSMAAPHVAGIVLLGSVSSGGVAGGDPDGNPDPIAVH